MSEPRTRARRHRNEINFGKDLRHLLYAYGDDREPLPETVKVLDEILTDYIIEICHSAASLATHSRRNKVKVDDFKFALRRDPRKLGRVQELLHMTQVIKRAREQFDEKIGTGAAPQAGAVGGSGVGNGKEGGAEGGKA
ncbi:MAG: Transcription initiation factor TFIID subunit 13 [Geoglossum umbratile]|nr:MAG: Transcription initiation factor TFIID subunit 13 [Geoglossum umbratile]